MKRAERDRARTLRQQGLSIDAIHREVGASQGSVSRWVRDIPLTQEQLSSLSSRQQHREKIAASIRKTTEARQDRFREEARAEWGKLRRDPQFMFGLGLYAGEGSKTGHTAAITNTDVDLLRRAVELLLRIGAKRERIHLCLNLHDPTHEKTASSFWRDVLNLPNAAIYVSTKVSSASQGKSRRVHVNGICRVGTNDTRLRIKLCEWLRLAS